MSNTSWLSGYFFLNSFDPGKKIKPEQLHHTYYAAKMYISFFKKKDFVKFCLDSDTQVLFIIHFQIQLFFTKV